MGQRKRLRVAKAQLARIWCLTALALVQFFCVIAWGVFSNTQGIAEIATNRSNPTLISQTSRSGNASTALVRAQTLNTQGANQLAAGQAEAAIGTWKQAEAAYKAAGDKLGTLGSQLNQVQALQSLGQYRRARTALEQINTQRFRVGDFKEAQAVLQSSLTISQRLNTNAGQSYTLLALGNLTRALQERQEKDGVKNATTEAISFYQRAATLAPDDLTRSQAKLNQLSLLAATNPTLDQTLLLSEIRSLLKRLPLNRASIYAQVNLAESLMKMSNQDQRKISQLLVNTIQQARELRDPRAEAYALGQLGHLYETLRQWSDAQKVTEQALQIAQAIQANDIAVSWQWQLGRVLKQQGQTTDAIAAYNQAVETLSVLRGDLVAMNPEVQFSFRGLQLLPPRWERRSPAATVLSNQLQTLAGGVSEARQGFSPLPGVVKEMEQISTLVPTSVLLNKAFTRAQLESRVESAPFPIVHLATHGQFSSEAERTFLLTWDGRINVKEFDQLLEGRNRQDRRPIELLILSACQTATGDKRAALGLAGVAVRSGARSTIATLWSVQDDSTAILMTRLYEELRQPGITIAEALRQAQLKLLRSPDYQQPFYWAPFVLVGNWQ